MLMNKNMIIVWGDGGICSQILFYSVGKYLSEKGYPVKFDLTFFKNNPRDCSGIFERNFDLCKAFPSLKIEEATEKEINYYKKHYPKKHNILENFCAPLYLNGYPPVLNYLLSQRQFFIDQFNPVDISNFDNVLKDIKKHNSCAIHVRRGDLVNLKGNVYGKICSKEYFLTAIKIILSIEQNLKFYFFSDEMDWVKENIISDLPQNIDYSLCEGNGSDKGYIDLYLISQCNHIIASKGSFEAFGRILSKNEGWFIGTLKSEYLSRYFDKCIFLSQDKETLIKHSESFESKKIGTRIKKILISCIPYKPLRKKLRRKYHVK